MLTDFTHDVYGNELSFNGNTQLKGIGAILPYSNDHVKEYVKCTEDIFYFAETYYKILSLTKGMITPKLRDYQYDMINNYISKRYNIVLATRQCINPDTIIEIKLNNVCYNITIEELYNTFNPINEYKILTDEGYKKFSEVNKLPKSKTIKLKTKSFEIEVSENHSFFDENFNEIIAKNLKINQLLQTKTGIEKITEIYKSKSSVKYDIIEVENERYYSNGILSHNCGKTTSIEIYIAWLILFHKDKRVAILANKEEQAKDILRKVKDAIELLPMFIKQGVKVWNVKNIILENNSSVIACATASNALRGKSCNLVVIDELAFVAQSIFDSFLSAIYPTISSSPDSKLVYISTFNGLNFFYKLWDDAKKGKNEFNPYEVKWQQVPLEGSSTGFRDEKWKEETISNIGIQKFRAEYNNEALGSISTLIEPDVINFSLNNYKQHLTNTQLYTKLPERIHSYCKIYYEPIKGHNYVIGVDSAKMTEDNAGDALGMQILDITSFPIKQVATFFISSGLSYLQSPDIIVKLAQYYNNAIVFIENNEIGQEVANMVHFDYEYDNVYWEKPNLPGFRTTKKTKRLGCTNLKLLIENNKLEVNDFDTISQLSTFIRKKDSYCAESGYSDDLIMALISAIFFLQVQGLDIDIIESSNDFAKKILDQNEFIKEEDEPMFGILPDDEYEQKPKGDFDWL